MNQAQAAAPVSQEAIQPHLAQVLLVDDNITVINLLKPQLENAGYAVVVAGEDEQALNLVRQAQPRLKLIILNLLMKNGQCFSLLEQLRQDETISPAPVLISSLTVDEGGQDLSIEVIDYIGVSFKDAQVLERVRSALTIATGDTQEIGPAAKSPSSRNGQYRILVVDDNEATVKWLKDALEAGGYKVHRAFNSQQALDVASGHTPDLVLIDLKMPDVNGASVISQLRQIAAPKNIPIIVIVDQPAPESNGLRMLGRENWAKIKPPFVTDALIAEIVQVGRKVSISRGKETIKL
jgi:CheY-like chemotaxis protein